MVRAARGSRRPGAVRQRNACAVRVHEQERDAVSFARRKRAFHIGMLWIVLVTVMSSFADGLQLSATNRAALKSAQKRENTNADHQLEPSDHEAE